MKISHSVYFTVLLGFAILTAGVHPFHLSVCEIDYNPGSKRLEVAIKLFSDDISNGIEEATGTNIHLGEDNETESADQELDVYIGRRLKVWVNEKPVNFTFLGRENNKDANVTWCYVESEELPEITSIKVRNQLLIEMFPTQKNIVHITVNEVKKSLLLDRDKDEEDIKL